MDFALSEERQMLKDTAERFVRERYPIETRHAATKSESGFDGALWAEFCELGLPGALMPAEMGGLGGSGEDIALVFEAVGRGIVVEPFLPTLLASVPLAAHGMAEALEAAMEGKTLLSFAHYEPEARYDANWVSTRAVERDGNWELTGRKAVVINGASADLIIVSARVGGEDDAEHGIALFNVSPNAPGVEVRGFGGIDGPHVAELFLENAHCHVLGDPQENAWPLIEKTLATGALAVSAEAIGIMDVCRDGTLAYLKERKQFGRPIGANQALQHRMVDMMLEIEQARSAVMLAANTLEAPRAERELNVSAAKNLVGRTARLVAEETIQMHGGVAMTWEWPLAHFAKRLVMIDHLFGDADHHLQRYIALGRDSDAPKVENATPGSDNPRA